jgi:methylated-DNA-[protein]-cysteine S-methyltransferase
MPGSAPDMTGASRNADVDYVIVRSPVGPLMLAGCEGRLRVLAFQSGSRARRPDRGWRLVPDAFPDVRAELDRYFAGRLRAFSVPVEPAGTPFQRRVWEALRQIPYGDTVSYLALATRLGTPKAVRAVGLANGANPIPIIIPCHRVVGADGSLVGFGGGLAVKRALLDLEQGQGTLEIP